MTRLTTLLVAGTALAAPATAQEAPYWETNRAAVAVPIEGGVYLGWRMFRSETQGASDTGLTGPSYTILRDGEEVATVTDSTNWLDPDGTPDASYEIRPEGGEAQAARMLDEGYLEIPLDRPEAGTTPAGEDYVFHANDGSVGDLDGDGELEVVLKWDPSNSKDVSQKGYTGPVLLDAYELDGTRLWRIDLGPNIRAGAHYTQFLVADFDGNGAAEVMVKTAPGTRDGTGAAIELLPEDIEAGFATDDDYRIDAAGYRAHLARMLEGWSDHPEVQAGNWPATVQEALGWQPTDMTPEEMADRFITEWAPARSERNVLTEFEGFIIEGPEYLTVFDGATGAALDTAAYAPGRGDDGLMWGDYAMSRVEPANRVDRFLATPAYLDGPDATPSGVFARGYYTRSTVAAWDWDGEALSLRWLADSGHVPMANPFDAAPHSAPGSNPEMGALAGQGFHSMTAADVDGDGAQEIVYGAATLDDDGSLLYSTRARLPDGATDAGAEMPLGHGDAMHVTDVDPSRDGMEIYTVHENGAKAPYGYVLRAAETGEVLWGGYTGRDTGRGLIGDIDPDRPGLEAWASRPGDAATEADATLRDATGAPIDGPLPGTNMSVLWEPDMTTQILTGSGDETPQVVDHRAGPLLSLDGTRTNNGTKGNPALVGDLLGDWREEVVVRTAESDALRIYTPTAVTSHRLFTLLADPQYRMNLARQQTAYNQPTYTSFHLGTDTPFAGLVSGEE